MPRRSRYPLPFAIALLVGAIGVATVFAAGGLATPPDATDAPNPTATASGIIGPLLGYPPTPTTAPTAPVSGLTFARTITEADTGGVVTVAAGQRIAVALHAPDDFDLWQVAPPDPQVLRPVPHPAAAATKGTTLRAFLAIAPGVTTLTAESRPQCQAASACVDPVRALTVTVIVTP